MATFYVDLPPAANNMYHNVAGKGRVKSGQYTTWIASALREMLAQRAKPVIPPVSITLELPDTMLGDLDGRIKPGIDLLVRAGVIPDDNKRFVRSVSASFYEGKQLRLTVQSLKAED